MLYDVGQGQKGFGDIDLGLRFASHGEKESAKGKESNTDELMGREGYFVCEAVWTPTGIERGRRENKEDERYPIYLSRKDWMHIARISHIRRT